MLKDKPLICETDIQNKVKEVAMWIDKGDYEKPPILIGILNGCIRFMGDLMSNINIDTEIDFFAISSYSKNNSNRIQLLKDLKNDIENRDIIVVEDIIDSGSSIKYINKLLSIRKPKSIKYAVLVSRKNMDIDFSIDKICFEVNDEWIVGYGFDYDEKYRNLNSIYEYEPK